MQIIRGRAGTPSAQRFENFTGTVWGDALSATGQDPVINNVVFAPYARTYWHRHEKGQLIVASNGLGLLVTAYGAAAILGVGDIAWVEGGEKHWHGAGPNSLLTHMASSFGVTDWLEEVTEQQYLEGLRLVGLDASVKGGNAA